MDVLLIEDSDGDAYLIQNLLSKGNNQARFVHCRRLAEGLQSLAKNRPDVILLDLALPDSDGLDTFVDAHAAADVPIVVLSGHDDEQLALTTVTKGAQDYLVKGDFDKKTLSRCLRYAVQRGKFFREQRSLQERELGMLMALSRSTEVRAAQQLDALPPLKKHAPELFDDLVAQYENLIGLSLEQRMYKVDHAIPGKLEEMGAVLGRAYAAPSDAVEIHRSALSRKSQGATVELRQAYVEEGRLLLLGLMGRLASHYRSHAKMVSAAKGENDG